MYVNENWPLSFSLNIIKISLITYNVFLGNLITFNLDLGYLTL